MIQAEGLVKRFPRHRRLRHVLRREVQAEITAVDGISFEVAAGEFVGYAGPNGAGKSTTVKMLSGILTPSEGWVVVDGLSPARQRRQLAERIGVVFGQRTQLWWDLPLADSFDLVRHLYGMPALAWRRRLDELTDLLALGPLLAQPVRSLSLGQRMRADLAAAVLPAPRVLFLDEPTIGLDVEAKAAVRAFLRDLNARDGTTVLLTTHDLDDITELCSRLIIIDHGRLVYDGTVGALHDAYGTTRMLVVDLVDPAAVVAPGLGWDGAEVVRAEGPRRWIRFARERVSAAALIARVLADHEVTDLSIVEPDIEDIIRRIYRGETRPAGPAAGDRRE
jgi:ABC-2 type transport system ATP-binding protein